MEGFPIHRSTREEQMKKLALDPETLKVQTFETSFVPEVRGTVMAAGTSACAITDCTCEPQTPCCWH
jgi:hypothetical protein